MPSGRQGLQTRVAEKIISFQPDVAIEMHATVSLIGKRRARWLSVAARSVRESTYEWIDHR